MSDPGEMRWEIAELRHRAETAERALVLAAEQSGKAERERDEARRENTCDACAGTGKPTSERQCMCGGTGKLSDAAHYLRSELFEARRDRDRFALDREEVLLALGASAHPGLSPGESVAQVVQELADERARAEKAERERDEARDTLVREANHCLDAEVRLKAARLERDEARRELGMAREREAVIVAGMESYAAHAGRLRAALEECSTWFGPTSNGSASRAVVVVACHSTLASTPAGSARLWRAMERAAFVLAEVKATGGLGGGTWESVDAALAEVEAARKEGP